MRPPPASRMAARAILQTRIGKCAVEVTVDAAVPRGAVQVGGSPGIQDVCGPAARAKVVRRMITENRKELRRPLRHDASMSTAATAAAPAWSPAPSRTMFRPPPPAPPTAPASRGSACFRIDNGAEGAERRSAFVPVLCQHCGKDTPCVSVCPQQAVDVDPATGIVGQMPERCLGCRYCMAACPYHARYFNWWDPAWPAGMEKTLNPDVSPRMRGVVEKCNFCHGRWHAAKAKAAADGKSKSTCRDYIPACVEACPTRRHPLRQSERPGHRSRTRLARTRTASACWNRSAPIPRFTTTRRRPGCAKSPTRRARAKENSPWLTAECDKEFITRGVQRCSTSTLPAVARALGRPARLRRCIAPACAWSKA